MEVREPEAEIAEDEPEKPEDQDKRSTLSRTTDWILKSIARVGQGGVPEPEAGEQGPDSSPARPSSTASGSGGKTSSWPERLQHSSRVQTRFVLSSAEGQLFTLGALDAGIGSGDSHPESEQLQWHQLIAQDGSIDAFHLRCGVEDGLFWVEDNNSIMGTVISEPGRAPLQCVPHERYFLVRGSLIQLGSVPLTLQ